MKRNLIVTVLVAVVMAGFVLAYTSLEPQSGGMGGMGLAGPLVPPVKGFIEGQEIRFIHTEVSDSEIADVLTQMMGSPVLVVPSLAEAPDELVANVYVFTNGNEGEGPLGFQPDVFDHPPGTPGYRPLRALNLITWEDASAVRLLTSAADVREADLNGEVVIGRPGVVINMPLLTWPGGQR